MLSCTFRMPTSTPAVICTKFMAFASKGGAAPRARREAPMHPETPAAKPLGRPDQRPENGQRFALTRSALAVWGTLHAFARCMLLSPKHIPRLAAIVGLFTRYGLRDVAKQQGLITLLPSEEDIPPEEVAEREAHAVGFRKRLVELGPAYVKLGQVLSTRPDLLPEPYIHELEKLQDDVGPIPLEEVEQIIEQELGARLSKLFDWFDPEPIGTASLGQVHAARMRGGREVVVKVQRPHIRASLADDLEFFQELAEFMADHTSVGARIDVLGVIQEMERAISEELDYRTEARNAATFRKALAEFPRIMVPKVIEAYSTERVLTMERIHGIKVDKVSPLTRIEHDFTPVADELTRAYLKGITLDGFFHADPHPGNVFVVLPGTRNPLTPSEVASDERRGAPRPATTPLAQIEVEAQAAAAPMPDDVDVRIALIDFGMTARLSASIREAATRLLMALGDNRGDDVAATLIEQGVPTDDFDRAGYTRAIATLIARNVDLTAAEVQAGKILFEVIDLSFQHGLRLPAEMTLLAKALFNLDGVTRVLDPHYTPITTIQEFSNEIALSRAKRDMSPRRLYQIAMESGDLLAALPRRLDVITQRLANNDIGAHVDIPQLPGLIVALQKVANRIFSGLVLAGLLVASSQLLPYWRTLGMIGFVIAALIALYMVLAIVVGDRRNDRG
jgi:predicted unusual protein kinase regulating ubiquinone biosynthesis (AarF/ABC1/UbiB family)